MNARHIEERSEMFMGEELVYYVTVIDPCPPPSDLNPYGDEGRCAAKRETSLRPVASDPVVAKRIPTKAEYIRSFARAGAPPACVAGTVRRNLAFVRKTRSEFGDSRNPMPRRLRKAIARIDLADLATHYDTGAIGRVSHYLYEHQGRVFAAAYAEMLS
jgi:hypothetical protein